MKKRYTPKAGLSVLVLSASLMCSGCLLPEEETFESVPIHEQYEGASYVTAECSVRDIIDQATISFKYVPVNTASLSFPVAGLNYDKFFFETGDTVKKGQLICQLDLGTLASDIETLNAELSDYERQLSDLEENRALELQVVKLRDAWLAYEERQENLDELNQRYDRQKLELEDLIYLVRLKKETCEAEIAKRQLVAPFDGVLTFLSSPEIGEESVVDKKIVVMADTSRSLFRASTLYWDRFTEGSEYTVINQKTNAEYIATVMSEKELGLKETEKIPGKEAMVYLVLNDPAFDLEDGNTGIVTLTLQEKYGVLAVPVTAVSVINDQSVVYFPDENGLRTYKEVTVGITNGHLTEILDGLNEGDTVIID